MEKLNKTEKAILWCLIKRDSVTTHISILGDEKIRQEFNIPEIQNAWDNLKKQELVSGEVRGGGLESATSYKKIKNLFKIKIVFYRIWLYIKKFWNFIWEHFLITIIVSTLVTIVTNYILKNY